MLSSWLPRFGKSENLSQRDEPGEPELPGGYPGGYDDDADETATIESQSEQNGLFPIHVPPEDTQYPPGKPVYAVDVVAVHGLGGDAYRTWQHRNGNIWLHHVSDELPGARIYTYGYDSGVSFSRGAGTLREFARHMLNLIRLARSTEQEKKRGLIFVCHSMGGLVVKQAFLIANNEKILYSGIKDAVSAILFLGTPHRGSSSASYATVLGRIANIFLFGSQASRVIGGFRTELLKSLQTNEGDLLRLAEEFRVHTPGIQISSFIEQEVICGMTERVVDNHSGEMGAATERILPMLGLDHRQLCKHASSKSQGLKMIFGELRDGASRSVVVVAEATSTTSAFILSNQLNQLSLTESIESQKNKTLLKAAECGAITAVMRLLENGADLYSYDLNLRTPLHLACLNGHHVIVQYLVLKKNAHVHEMDANRMQPLHLAAMKGSSHATATLLGKGADPNAEDKDGFTALHRGACSGDDQTVHHLLSRGADLTKRNNNGELPVRIARRLRHFTVMKILQQEAAATSQLTVANLSPNLYRDLREVQLTLAYM